MHEIKFRAWDKENKKMYAVEEITWGSDGLMNGLLQGFNGRVFLGKRVYVDNKWYDDYALMQFTGLHDKNGREIWEGDIVRIKADPPFTFNYMRKIQFDSGMFGVMEQNINKIIPIHLSALKICEVIGNIYENPDLLKKA